MNDREAAFVEAMGQYMASYGLTPMAGRLWAWLLICEPSQQSAAELADAMKASRGAISGAAAFLAASGMIRRTRKRGDRRELFSAPPGTFDAILGSVRTAYGRLAQITGDGVAVVSDRPPEAQARIREVHDASVFIATTFPSLVEEYLRGREERGLAGDTAGNRAAR